MVKSPKLQIGSVVRGSMNYSVSFDFSRLNMLLLSTVNSLCVWRKMFISRSFQTVPQTMLSSSQLYQTTLFFVVNPANSNMNKLNTDDCETPSLWKTGPAALQLIPTMQQLTTHRCSVCHAVRLNIYHHTLIHLQMIFIAIKRPDNKHTRMTKQRQSESREEFTVDVSRIHFCLKIVQPKLVRTCGTSEQM